MILLIFSVSNIKIDLCFIIQLMPEQIFAWFHDVKQKCKDVLVCNVAYRMGLTVDVLQG